MELRKSVWIAALAMAGVLAGSAADARTHHHHHQGAKGVATAAGNDVGNLTTDNTTTNSTTDVPQMSNAQASLVGLSILGLLVVAFGALLYFSVRGEQRRNALEAAKRSNLIAGSRELETFLTELKFTYPYNDHFENRRFMLLSADASELRFLKCSIESGSLVLDTDLKMAINGIRAVELVERHRQVAHGVSTARRPGAVGRAIVGGPDWGTRLGDSRRRLGENYDEHDHRYRERL